MRREQHVDVGCRDPLLEERDHRGIHTFLERLHEAGVVEVETHLVGGDALFQPRVRDRQGDVLAVLTVAGV
jgi:hypothetical protein